MYILYIDESENSDSKDPFKPNVFGLSGLLITARYIPTFVQNIRELKEDYEVSGSREIKGYEIFNQNKWNNLSDDERREFCKELSEIIVGKNSLAKGFFIYKNSKFHKEDYLNCLEKIIDKAAEFVAKRGSNTSKQLLVIFDEKDEFERKINETILNKKSKKCKIIDHGFPGKSNMSDMLQAADFSGYVMRLNKTISKEDNLFARKKDSRFIEFVNDLVGTLKKKISIIELK